MAKMTWTVNGKKIPIPPLPFPGIPPFPWDAREKFVRDFVTRHGLRAATQAITINGDPLPKVPPWWRHGGPREPHLHLGNDIYLLDRAQWAEFVRGLAADMDMKIDTAPKINFASLADKAIEAELRR